MCGNRACPPPLQALAKYAFGMGTLQVLGCTGIFALCALPVGHGIATQVWEGRAGGITTQVHDWEANVGNPALRSPPSDWVERGLIPRDCNALVAAVQVLETVAGAPHSLVSIRSVDEVRAFVARWAGVWRFALQGVSLHAEDLQGSPHTLQVSPCCLGMSPCLGLCHSSSKFA